MPAALRLAGAARCVPKLRNGSDSRWPWGRGQVSRHLKALGLRRGQLPPEQLEQLRRLFEEHRGRRACYRLVAEGMNNG